MFLVDTEPNHAQGRRCVFLVGFQAKSNGTILGRSQIGKLNNRRKGRRSRLQHNRERMRSQKEGVSSGKQVEKEVQVWTFENKEGCCVKRLLTV